MNSGIAKGGVGIFNPSKGRWKFIFLKWFEENIRFVQIADLKQLSNGVWIAALGAPQAIVISRDLKNWHPLYIESISERFNYYMKISEGSNSVTCSTDNILLTFNKDEFERMFDAKLVMSSYKAYIDKLKGISFIFKRRFNNC